MKKVLLMVFVIIACLLACVCYVSMNKKDIQVQSDVQVSENQDDSSIKVGESLAKVYFTKDISPKGLLKI